MAPIERVIASGVVHEAPSVLDLQHAMFYGINQPMARRHLVDFAIALVRPLAIQVQLTLYVRDICRADFSDEGTLFLVQGSAIRVRAVSPTPDDSPTVEGLIGQAVAIRFRVSDRAGQVWVFHEGQFDSPLIRAMFDGNPDFVRATSAGQRP